MAVFELVIALLAAGCVLSLIANRLRLPYPALLAMAGAALALVPAAPSIDLDPRLALSLLVAPVILDAAYDTSLRDLRDNWRPVALLSVVLVCVTTAAVAWLARVLVPDMPWAVAVALGATVSPPDAVAATTVLRRLAPPYRLVVVLEGESLLNDATALLIWNIAVGVALRGSFHWQSALPMFLLTSLGGVAAGYALARLFKWLTRRVDDTPINVLLQFLVTFGVWLFAQSLQLSAIITTVTYGVTVAQSGGRRTHDARLRLTSFAIWEVVVLGLNMLAFILIGLQLRGILGRMHGQVPQFLGFAVAMCAAVVVVRFVWVMSYNAGVQWKNRHFGVSLPRPMDVPTYRTGLVVAWCGMRGIVTLATALALPDHGAHGPFPHRDLLVFAAFAVVLFTLVVQGLSLPALLAILGVRGDESVANEVRYARAETARAALAALDGEGPEIAVLRREYEARLRRADAGHTELEPPGLAQAVQRAVEAERAVLLALRARQEIGDAAYRRLEEELDLAEIDAEARMEEE